MAHFDEKNTFLTENRFFGEFLQMCFKTPEILSLTVGYEKNTF